MTNPNRSEPLGASSAPEPARIVVVDDEVLLLNALDRSLGREGYAVETYRSAEEAMPALRSHASDVNVVLADLRMPGMDGLEFLAVVRESWPELPVVLMSGQATVGSAIAALRSGAYDYLLKPFDAEEQLFPVIRRATEHSRLARRNCELERRLNLSEPFEHMIGHCAAMRTVFELVRSVAPSGATVLVLGETGTGKELVARALHARSPRSARPFVAINCAAFTESLLESELFGHVRGAYTGAVETRRGLFEQASGGTLFLDEIAELSPATQARLLRVLDNGKVRPLGGEAPKDVDVRVIAATHRDLAALVANGAFRQDLYFRINVVSIALPPLRERIDDVPLLVRHFLDEHAARTETCARALDGAALAALCARSWPGNVRELKNVVERALTLARGDTLQLSDLSVAALLPEPVHPLAPPGIAGFAKAKAGFEQAYLEQVLERAEGNISEAARLAEMDRSQLRRILRRSGLKPPAAVKTARRR